MGYLFPGLGVAQLANHPGTWRWTPHRWALALMTQERCCKLLGDPQLGVYLGGPIDEAGNHKRPYEIYRFAWDYRRSHPLCQACPSVWKADSIIMEYEGTAPPETEWFSQWRQRNLVGPADYECNSWNGPGARVDHLYADTSPPLTDVC